MLSINFFTNIRLGKKAKFTLEQAVKAHKGFLYSLTQHEMGMGGYRHAPAVSPPQITGYLLYRRLGGPQGRSEQMREISAPTAILSPDRPVRSQSLHRLHAVPRWSPIQLQGGSNMTGTICV